MYKYFGRLAGSTQSGQTLTESSPINSNTPFDPLVPATKFIAYGEDANSSTYNRALSALANNIDDLAGVLDAPALRYEVLEPDPAPNNQASYGNSNLVSLASMINVANLGQGARRPVSWVFVGLHQSKVGDFLQLERVGGGADNQIHTPVTVFQNSLADLYFPVNPNYPASAGQHGAPDLIPGITPIVTDLPPYNGASLTTGIASWDADGCYLSAADPGQVNQYSWKDLYLQPGCFVFVEGGNAQQNRGLYRIASLTGGTSSATSKAVLTNALTKVTIATAAEANFPVGSRVSWRSRPNQTAASTEVTRTHRAYVMYKDVPAAGGFAYLYLANFSGGTDFPVQGSTSFKAIPGHNGTETFNQFGLLELEVGAGQNANLVLSTGVGTGTTLHGTGGSTETLSVLPAGVTPPFLAGSHGAQTIMPHSPPGFVLNPSISLGGGANQIGGTFRAHCHVLTTVRDNLLSGGLSATRGSSSMFGRSQFSPGYKSVLERFARWAHVGDVPDAQVALTNSHLLSSEFGPTRQVMGHSLYAVVFSAPPAGLTAGSVITLDQPVGTNQVKAVVVSVAGSLAVLKNVVSLVESVSYQRDPIKVNQVINGQPAITVVSAYRPDLHFASWQNPGVYAPFYPSEGLDAAYHADYSSNPFLRGQAGQGNRIYSIGNRPITMVLPSLGDTDIGFQVESDRQANGQSYTVLRAGPVGAGTGDLALDIVNGTTLRIKDGNATAGVSFSLPTPGTSVSNSSLTPTPDGPCVLGSINIGVSAANILQTTLPDSILTGGAVTDAGGLAVDVAVGSYAGVYGRYQVGASATLTLPANSTRVVRWDGLSSYRFDAQFPAGGELAPIPLALVTTGANSISSIVDLRMLASTPHHKVDIHVGGYPGFPTQAAYGAHFATVGEAVKFIKSVTTSPVSSANWGTFLDRKFRILVRGSTVEPETITLSTSVSGLTIEGFEYAATINWGGTLANQSSFNKLFDLAGADGVTFRNLAVRYTNTNATAASTKNQRCVFYSNSSCDRILLDNIRITADPINRLSCFIDLVASSSTIQNCNFEYASDLGITVTGDKNVIQNCELYRAALTNQVAPTPQDPGYHAIKTNGRANRILDSKLTGTWSSRGIHVVGECALVRGCDILAVGSTVAGVWPVGIYIQGSAGNSLDFIVDGCTTYLVVSTNNNAYNGVVNPVYGVFADTGIGGKLINNVVRAVIPTPASAGAAGYKVGSEKTLIHGNTFYQDPAGQLAGTHYGVEVTSSKCIIDANQTGGLAALAKTPLSIAANNSIGAMNRDDA